MPTKLAKRASFQGSGPVRYRLESSPEGQQTSITFAVDYAEAPAPEHYYVADYYEMANQDPQVLFVFGKFNSPSQNQLRNKVEIYFPAIFFVKQLWKSSREFHGVLRNFNEQYGYRPIPPGQISGTTERVQTRHSNNVLMVLSGGECMMDFFYLSPRDVSLKTKKGQDVELEPLVRVIIAPNLLLGFLDACEPIAESLIPKYSGKEEDDEVLES